MIQKDLISGIMTKSVVTLEPDDSLEKARQLFEKQRVRHIPIVSQDALIGMLSYSDLRRLNFDSPQIYNDSMMEHSIQKTWTIEQIMNQNITTIPSTLSIKSVAEILASKETHALPVVNAEEKLVGIVTTTDLIHYLLKQF